MKKRLLMALFITTVFTAVNAGTPSGYVSLNFQETKPSVNKNVVYVKPSQHYYMMYSGVLNPEIKMYNTMVAKDGTRVAYPVNVMRNMVAQNTETMIDTLQNKLNVINRKTKGGIYPDGNGGVKEINLREVDSLGRPVWLPWLITHTENDYIKFHLNPGDSVYLLGRYGDSAKNQYGYVAYGENADGWFGVIKLDNGQKFLGYRVACENLIRGWQWLLNGKAEIVETQEEEQQAQGDDGVEKDPLPAKSGNGKRKTFVNGKELVTSGNGDTYITINNSNDNNSNNIATGGKGGAANANATNKSSNGGFSANPDYTGPSTAYTRAPAPSPMPYVQPVVQPLYQPVYQPYYQTYQQPYYGSYQPYRSGINLSFGFNLGGGNNGGCFGGYNTYPRYNQPVCNNGGGNWPGPRPNPGPGPQGGHFQPNGSGTYPGATQPQGGRFQSNGTGHL